MLRTARIMPAEEWRKPAFLHAEAEKREGLGVGGTVARMQLGHASCTSWASVSPTLNGTVQKIR